jgi:hypothetical protein
MASVRSRRFVLRGVGAGCAALVAARGRDVLGLQGSGSISIQGFLCPPTSSPPGADKYAVLNPATAPV